MCDLETSTMRRPGPELGCCTTEKDIYIYIYIYIFSGGSSPLCMFNSNKLKYRQVFNAQQPLLDVKKQ